MKKTRIVLHLSLRCKFKSPETVEVTVVDHDTGETNQILWNFKQSEVVNQVELSGSETEVVKAEDESEESEGADEDD